MPQMAGATADPELLVRYRAAEGLGLLEAGRGGQADPQVVNVLAGVPATGAPLPALRDGDRVIFKGSALRSPGIEPFLKKLNEFELKEFGDPETLTL